LADDASQDVIELRIDSLAAGGDGVARDASGRVTFVPRTAPGEQVRAVVVEEHRGFARAEPLSIEEPAAARVEPPCPLFASATCGGCQWQHLGQPAQAAAKEKIVADALRHAVGAGLRVHAIATPVSPYNWRRRARFHWYRGRGASHAAIGFFAPRSHHVTDVERCPQIEESLERALEVLREELAPHVGRKGEIVAVAGHAGTVHISIHGSADAGAAERLASRAPIVGVRLGRRHFGERAVELEPGMSARADDFAQASREGNLALRASVVEAAAPSSGRRVLELYAGTGNFTRPLAEAGAEVVAVERGRAPEAIGPSVTWLRASAEDGLAALVEDGESFDLALLDPPRTGAREALDGLIALAPPRILYVSCDPATLARDLGGLMGAGYEALWAQPWDLMPQTAHVEVVVELKLRSGG
jgi:23S rRNA (uracil1939-C5)-methyltransferase